MGILNRLFRPKEIRGALGVLDELEARFDNDAFRTIRNEVQHGFLRLEDQFCQFVRAGTPVRQIVLQAVANTTGDHLESGRHHIRRGVFDPHGIGDDLLLLFDEIVDDLVHLGTIDAESAHEKKREIRICIQQAG